MPLLQTAGRPCQLRRSHPSRHAVRTLGNRRLPVVLALVAAFLLPWPAQAQTPTTKAPAAAFQKLPLIFETNAGQVDGEVKFLSRGPGYTLFLTPPEAVLALLKAPGDGTVVRITLISSHADPPIPP